MRTVYSPDACERPTLAALAWVVARAGNSTFGGGTASIVALERQIIDRRGWVSRADSHLAYVLSRLTPGTNMLAYCAGVGWRVRGATGTVVTVSAASLPSAVAAAVLTAGFSTWTGNPYTASALKGALAAAIALMAGTGWTMLRPGIKDRRIRTLLIAAIAFGAGTLTGVAPLRVLIAAAVGGALWPEPRST